MIQRKLLDTSLEPLLTCADIVALVVFPDAQVLPPPELMAGVDLLSEEQLVMLQVLTEDVALLQGMRRISLSLDCFCYIYLHLHI